MSIASNLLNSESGRPTSSLLRQPLRALSVHQETFGGQQSFSLESRIIKKGGN